MTFEEFESFLPRLPIQPPQELFGWMREQGDLGTNALIYRTEYVKNEIDGRSEKVMKCTCSACGGSFYAGHRVEESGCYRGGGRRYGFIHANLGKIWHRDTTYCPICMAPVTAVHVGMVKDTICLEYHVKATVHAITKALRLLSLPAEEREEFVQEHNVEKMSSRDLEKALKERDEANRRAQLAEEKASAAEQAEERVEKEKAKVAAADTEIYRLQKQLETAQADLIKAKEAEKKAKEKAKELKENPVIAQDVLERMQAESDAKAKAEATAEMEDAVAEANERIIAAITAKESAERVAKEAIERAEMLRRQIEMSNPDIIEFKTVFREVQQNVARLQEIKARVQTTDPESASKLAAALHAFLVSQQEGR